MGIGWLTVSTISYGAGFPLGFALAGTLLWCWVVAGSGLGILQWVLVVNLMPRPGWFALGGGAIGALVGLSVGVTQWLALRQQAARSIWWIPANLLGYTGGLLAGCQVPPFFPLPAQSFSG